MGDENTNSSTESSSTELAASDGPASPQGADKKEYELRASYERITNDFINEQAENDWPCLSYKYRVFAEEYVSNGYDHRQAANDAGFSREKGIVLTRNPFIKTYVSYIRGFDKTKSLVTRDFVDSKLAELYDMAIGDEKIDQVTSKGETFAASLFDGKLALGILQERAKINGIYETGMDSAQELIEAFKEMADKLPT